MPNDNTADRKPAGKTRSTKKSDERAPVKARFVLTLGTIDCRQLGLDPGQPPQSGQTRTISAAAYEILLKRGVVEAG